MIWVWVGAGWLLVAVGVGLVLGAVVCLVTLDLPHVETDFDLWEAEFERVDG